MQQQNAKRKKYPTMSKPDESNKQKSNVSFFVLRKKEYHRK